MLSKILRHPRRSRRSLLITINAGALAILTASLAHWTWLFLQPPSTPIMQALANEAPVIGRPLDIQPLLATHLFGQVAVVTHETSSATPQPSNLNLVLTGIIGVKDAGLAIISVNSQPQEPFMAGQTITDNAVLHAVYPDRIIIMRNGVMESLLLDPTAAGTPILLPERTKPMGRPSASGVALNQNTVKRDTFLDQVRITDALQQSNFTPVTGGLLVRNGQKGHILENFGVQEGDVIRSINGQSLNTTEDALRAYQVLLTTTGNTQIQIEITRHGQPQLLQYRLE